MEDEVKHYVVYHNTEVMGYRPRDFDDLDEGTSFSIATNKSVTNLPGNIIWLISGEERPRKYYLCSVFVVDEVGSLEADDFKNYAAGQQGISFHPPIRLDELDWFGHFLNSQYRFGFGLREILEQKFIDELEKIADRAIEENPDLLMNSFRDSPLDQIERLSAEHYKSALIMLQDEFSETQMSMLRSNYEAPNHTTTATSLARAVGFTSFSASNLHYGRLARRFCEIFHIQPRQNLSVLVIFEKPENEWHWIMRPQLVNAIRDLGWFSDSSTPNILGDLEQQRQTYETVDQTTRQAIVQSRIGQGQFRIALIDYWAGCAVTGCQVVDLLVASHIKPWRDANNVERLDRFNGLLLQPNLDAAFDKGYISFDDSGRILISRSLSSEALLQLGINFSMKLRWVEEGHRQYLEYHRRVNGF